MTVKWGWFILLFCICIAILGHSNNFMSIFLMSFIQQSSKVSNSPSLGLGFAARTTVNVGMRAQGVVCFWATAAYVKKPPHVTVTEWPYYPEKLGRVGRGHARDGRGLYWHK